MRASPEVEHRSLSTRRGVEDAFAQVPSSLAVVAARLDRRPLGMVVSSLAAGSTRGGGRQARCQVRLTASTASA